VDPLPTPFFKTPTKDGGEELPPLKTFLRISRDPPFSITEQKTKNKKQKTKNKKQKSFGIIYEGQLNFDEDGFYEYQVGSDDGFRLYVNGELVCSFWSQRVTSLFFLPFDFPLAFFILIPVTRASLIPLAYRETTSKEHVLLLESNTWKSAGLQLSEPGFQLAHTFGSERLEANP